jgi:spore germination cell wall hydrolase CwlJ-like protein
MRRLIKFWIVLLAFCPALGFTQPSELDCLTTNVFFEARGESLAGKRAVADVTINRTKHSAFTGQDTVCKVVFARGQFSWTTQPRKRTQRLLNGDFRGLKDSDVTAYHLSRKVSVEALGEGYKPLLPRSVVSFHSLGVKPDWSSKMRFHTKIGKHRFYSFKRRNNSDSE